MIKLKDILNECNECGRARDWNHGHDHEAGMAKNELRDMISNASKIDTMVQDSDNLPGWVSAYISLAADYMHSVAEYLAGESSKMQQEPQMPTPGYAMYEERKNEKRVQKETKQIIPQDWQFNQEQLDLLTKQYKAILRTSNTGTTLYIPDSVYDGLVKNKKDSDFKQAFYDTGTTGNASTLSTMMSNLKKAINLGNTAVMNNKKYYVVKGAMSPNKKFSIPNQYHNPN